MKTSETFENKEETDDNNHIISDVNYLLKEMYKHKNEIEWLKKSVLALVIYSIGLLICITILALKLAI